MCLITNYHHNKRAMAQMIFVEVTTLSNTEHDTKRRILINDSQVDYVAQFRNSLIYNGQFSLFFK